MNLLDFPLNEPVQFERLTYINGLNGIEPGPRREYAVLGDLYGSDWVGSHGSI
jgi:hypothetical protein